MLVSALSYAGLNLESTHHYRAQLTAILKEKAAVMAVLPAHSALLLGISSGAVESAEDFSGVFQNYIKNHISWNDTYLQLHSALARDLGIYIVAGTQIESDKKDLYHSSFCIDPTGKICCRQRQTHLTLWQREAGLSRGDELPLFKIRGLKTGILVDNDARHPETGRILGLQGADLVAHCGALEGKNSCWSQTAGIWSQVQQNQFWAVEAQLSARILDKSFEAAPAIIGPCEITPSQSGYLARGYPHTVSLTASLNEASRHSLKEKYPLLKLLNPPAYSDIYHEEL